MNLPRGAHMWTALIRLTSTCLKTEGSAGPRKMWLCQLPTQGGCFCLRLDGCLWLRLGSGGLGRNSCSPCLLNHESQGEDREESTDSFHAAN